MYEKKNIVNNTTKKFCIQKKTTEHQQQQMCTKTTHILNNMNGETLSPAFFCNLLLKRAAVFVEDHNFAEAVADFVKVWNIDSKQLTLSPYLPMACFACAYHKEWDMLQKFVAKGCELYSSYVFGDLAMLWEAKAWMHLHENSIDEALVYMEKSLHASYSTYGQQYREHWFILKYGVCADLNMIPSSFQDIFWNLQGAMLYNKGMCQLAIVAFNKAISIQPWFATYYSHLSRCYLELNNLTQAKHFVEKAIEYETDGPHVHVNWILLFEILHRSKSKVIWPAEDCYAKDAFMMWNQYGLKAILNVQAPLPPPITFQ